MDKLTRSRKHLQILAAAFCLILFGAACMPAIPATQALQPSLPTIAALQAATPPATVPVIPSPTFTPQPTVNPEALPGLAGKWADPQLDGSKTITIIEWQNGTYLVPSVINTSRGANEIKTFSWANGVLTWEYCPPIMQHCIIQNIVSLNGDTLTVDWTWSGGGNSGTSDLQRQP